MKNEHAFELILQAKEVLSNLVFAMENDIEFAMKSDIADLVEIEAKVRIARQLLILNPKP